MRVPVGYWLLAETADDAATFVPNAYQYLDTAFKWGAKYGIGVLVDMHAAPASQNGCVCERVFYECVNAAEPSVG